jgi:hypothetical protein
MVYRKFLQAELEAGAANRHKKSRLYREPGSFVFSQNNGGINYKYGAPGLIWY